MQAHFRSIKRRGAHSVKDLWGRFKQALWALLPVALGLPASAHAQSMRMMDCGSMMGGMMWVMVVFWLLIAVLAVLAVVALIKYIFGGK